MVGTRRSALDSIPDRRPGRADPDPGVAPRRRRLRVPSWVPPALLLAAILGFWQVWFSVRHIEDFVLPTPARIARAAVDTWPLLPEQIWATVVASLLGMVIGGGAGLALQVLVLR